MFTAVIVLSILLAVLLVSLIVVYLKSRPPRAATPAEQRLKVWTAEQLSMLTPEQSEAVQLFAWASRQGWRTAVENVQLGSEYPLAKKATSHEENHRPSHD
jgi:hypothetical protein